MHTEPCADGCGAQIQPDQLAIEASRQGVGIGWSDVIPPVGGRFFLAEHWPVASPDTGLGPLWSKIAGPTPLRELPGYR